MARFDPYKNFKFKVSIDAITVSFSECTGLDAEVSVIEYREGGDHIVRKLPGLIKYSNITLKRGITDSLELYNWFKAVMQGQNYRRDGSVVLLDDEMKEVTRWHFKNAWPCKYEGPKLNAKGNEVAIEILELACEGIERE